MFYATLIAASLASPMSPTVISECDRVASHPDDPDRVAPGLEREQIDLVSAEKTCRKAVEMAPENARSNYHLGRVLFYGGKQSEAMPYLEKAAAIGYRQAIFIVGYSLASDPSNTANMCRSQNLFRRGVGLDHPWSGYHLVEKKINGAYDNCPDPVSKAELRRALDLAVGSITVEASDGRVEALQARAATYLDSNGKE